MRKDALQYFFSRILPSIVSLAVIIAAIRFLGPQEYGQFALTFAAAMLVSSLTFGWIRQSIRRFIYSGQENIHLLVNRFFYLTFVSILVAVAALVIILWGFFNADLAEIIIVSVYLGFYTLFQFHLSIHQARQQLRTASLFEGLYYTLFPGFLILFFFLIGYRDFLAIFLSMALALIITELVRILTQVRSRERVEITHIFWDTRFNRNVVSYGHSMTLWVVISLALSVADRFILKIFHGYTTAGVYASIGDLLLILVTFICMPILNAYQPKIMEDWNTNHREEAMKQIKEAFSFELFACIVIFVLFMVFRHLILQNLLRLEGNNIYLLSGIMILNAFLWQVILLFQKPLELLSRQRLRNLGIIVALAVNISANILLVPLYGYIASAIISLSCYLFYFLIIGLIYRKILNESADTED